ncbi:L,D-transpeptidase [Streptomyces odontomachi]|uniref:L,D-transpeptidase n=1 Tax=Streptomyces odontomachi TaxID=2944940 RepID=UPI00210C409C|nr:Ig-like domain-containing protein [Streptomyces sp. ODS25]
MLLLATACGGDDSDGGGKNGKASPKPVPKAAVTVSPKDGADSVDTTGALKVSASGGRLTQVEVEDSKGHPVDGMLSEDGASWRPSGHLALSTTYTVHARAKNSQGRETVEQTTFKTLKAQNTFIGRFTPEDGSKVGVGMPFSLNFTRGITHPEDVEKAITITTEPKVEVKGHWFGNDRLDFRPEEYWEPGTKVTAKLDLDGVEGRSGVYGTQAKSVTFTIGRAQISTVDAKTHQMKVERDGKVIKKIPITSGSPGHTTYNGQMVISEKYHQIRMDSHTVGLGGAYDIKDVPHAMRLSTSGTFIHGNYWAGGAFGNYNASHGCVGIRDVKGAYDSHQPAAWFYNNSLIGDIVIVKNSKDKKIQPDNGLNGWNMSWADWTK